MSAKKEKNTTTYWINTAIVLFCFFGFGLLPSFAGLSYAGMRTVGIFIGLLWGWITVEFAWVSLIGIIAMGTTGAMTMAQVLTESFGSTTFMQLIFPMILLAYVGMSGASEYIGYKIVAAPFAKGKPWVLTTLIFVAATVLDIFVTTFPMIFIMWALFLGIAEVVGFQKGDRYVAYVLSGIVFMQSIMSAAIPWHFYCVTLQNLMKDALGGAPMPFNQILLLGIIAAVLEIAVWVLIGKYILRLDVSKMANLPDSFYEKAASMKLTNEGKLGIGLVVALVVMMGAPEFLPACALKSFLSSLGLQGVCILLLGVLLAFRYANGKGLATTNELAKNGLSWDITFLVVSTLSLAALMKAPDVGIIPLVTKTLIPIVGSMPKSMFVVACLVIFWFATQATHNFVIVLTLVGAMAGVCSNMGIHPWLFGFMFMCGMMFAYSTPAASSPGALIFAHDWIKKGDAYLCGILFSALGFLAFIVVCLPLAGILFGPWGV